MKRMILPAFQGALMLAALFMVACTGNQPAPKDAVSADHVIKTSVGDFVMDGEMPAKESLEKIYHQLDLQQATQAFSGRYRSSRTRNTSI